MANIPLRQIRAVIAVCEEGSFTRAAERENATQSGISQHVAAVERTLGVKLFERSAARHRRRRRRACATTRAASRRSAGSKMPPRRRARLAGHVTGDLRIGLMPTFTRAVLAPMLDDFVPRHPDVRLHVVRGLQRRADRHGAGGRARFRAWCRHSRDHRAEVAIAGARPGNADLGPRARASRRSRRCGSPTARR